jgi:hypothetical protein
VALLLLAMLVFCALSVWARHLHGVFEPTHVLQRALQPRGLEWYWRQRARQLMREAEQTPMPPNFTLHVPGVEDDLYRLSDEIRDILRQGVPLLEAFPDSIVAAYLRETQDAMNLPVLARVLAAQQAKHGNGAVKVVDASSTLVVHVRMGDVVENKPVAELEDMLAQQARQGAAKGIYVRSLEYYALAVATLDRSKVNTVILVTGSHRAIAAYPNSWRYLQVLRLFFQGLGLDTTLRPVATVDEDFLCLTSAKVRAEPPPRGGGGGGVVCTVLCWVWFSSHTKSCPSLAVSAHKPDLMVASLLHHTTATRVTHTCTMY